MDGGREALGTREPQGSVNVGRVPQRDRPPWLPFPLSAGCSSDLLLPPPSPRLRAWCESVLLRLLVFSTGVFRLCPAGVSCLVFLVCLCVLLLLLRPRVLRSGEEEREDVLVEDIEVTDSSRVPSSSNTGAAGKALACVELSLCCC